LTTRSGWGILKAAKVGSFQGHTGEEFSKAISGEFFKAIDTRQSLQSDMRRTPPSFIDLLGRDGFTPSII
ncbi:MAG: hypothetical protein H7831_14900, partial [Magnetococcus sp. WYHC-3]